MKDAFGGAFMIRIFLVFILVYIIFTSVALNYAKAFKVKNLVISYLEDNEIADIGKNMTAAEYDAMRNYFDEAIVNTLNYRTPKSLTCPNPEIQECRKFEDLGILIVQTKSSEEDINHAGVYYKVSTYFGFNLGFLRLFTTLSSDKDNNATAFGTWEITGETRLIVRDKNQNNG